MIAFEPGDRVYQPSSKRYGTVAISSEPERSLIRWDLNAGMGWTLKASLRKVPRWDTLALRQQATALLTAGWSDEADEAIVTAKALNDVADQLEAIESALGAVTPQEMRRRIEIALGWNDWPAA